MYIEPSARKKLLLGAGVVVGGLLGLGVGYLVAKPLLGPLLGAVVGAIGLPPAIDYAGTH